MGICKSGCKYWVDAFDTLCRQSREFKDNWMLGVLKFILTKTNSLAELIEWKKKVFWEWLLQIFSFILPGIHEKQNLDRQTDNLK